ncbi:MAG: glycosyltransferase family 4 protein [Candidatus Omnitrophota bacterium]
MKILQVVHSFLPYTRAGTEVYTHSLSKELSNRNELTVFFRINDRSKTEFLLIPGFYDGLKTYALNRTFDSCNSFGEVYDNEKIDKVFANVLDEIKPDVVHIQHLLFLSLGIVREAKKRKIPVVFTINDYWLFCHKGQLLKEDYSICQCVDINHCRKCLRSQLSLSAHAAYFYNRLRTRLPYPLLQVIKNAYLYFSGKIGLSPQDKDTMLKDRYARALEVANSVDIMISPSEFARKVFIACGVAEDKIIHSPYGLIRSDKAISARKPAKAVTFGYLGTVLPMKGIEILLDAFRAIKHLDIRLLVFGKLHPYVGYEGYSRLISKQVRQDKRVRLMGEFDNAQAPAVFSQFDCLVVPSIWPENAPLVIQEAFWAKTPVIASRIGGIPELIREDIDGLLFNPGDTQDLRAKMESFIEKPEIIERLRKNILPPKGMEEHAVEIENIYTELIEGSGVARKIREAEVAG